MYRQADIWLRSKRKWWEPIEPRFWPSSQREREPSADMVLKGRETESWCILIAEIPYHTFPFSSILKQGKHESDAVGGMKDL